MSDNIEWVSSNLIWNSVSYEFSKFIFDLSSLEKVALNYTTEVSTAPALNKKKKIF